jgi:hypothetical protein
MSSGGQRTAQLSLERRYASVHELIGQLERGFYKSVWRVHDAASSFDREATPWRMVGVSRARIDRPPLHRFLMASFAGCLASVVRSVYQPFEARVASEWGKVRVDLEPRG